MSMSCRNDQLVVIVLQGHQFVRKQARVMIVDQSDRTHDRRFWISHGARDQPVPHQIAKRFGAVRITLLCDEAIEAGQQIGSDGDADTREFFPCGVLLSQK